MVMQIELENITQYAKGVNVYIEGSVKAYPVGCEKFEEICVRWNEMLVGAHQMPAFGVSLHEDTLREMQKGVWAEFEFDGRFTSNEMSYEKLLVAVRPDWCAFNIIRYVEEQGYYGRCFHYNLGANDMSAFYKVLTDNK